MTYDVVVIGSGATAVTLVPAMATTAAHVTMLQRSPTYILSRPAVDRLARRLATALPARTVGDVTCTGCVESTASTVDEVIAETAVSRLTERGATRADDRISEAGMEDRKREGYF